MFRRLWKARGLWLRILFCWALGSTFPFFDEVKHYDLRFALRGSQDVSHQIAIVTLDQDDWNTLVGSSTNWRHTFKDASEISDSYFWRPHLWNQMLGAILSQQPKSIGVTFFFNPFLPPADESLQAIYDRRVIWGARLDHEGRPAMPILAVSGTAQVRVGLIDLREDEDRILRRFSVPLGNVSHLATQLVDGAPMNSGEMRLINFRGPRSIFPSVSATAVVHGRVPPEFFKNKIVIIGSNSLTGFQTPLGYMNRADVMAQIVDNVQNGRWIKRFSPWAYSLYMFCVLMMVAFILVQYPQPVGLVFLIWFGLGTTALSMWVFDTFYTWIPAFSPLMMALLAYVIFIGYQLSLKENQTWRLEQEKHLLSELDQLRNNFVSLISHDLKTPIAKIQAICDRLLATGTVSQEVREGLSSLRKESVELHRYIQSILQISRLESNKVQLRKEPTDFNEVVEKVVEQIRPLSDDKRQELCLKLEPMFSMELDGVLIHEVILNLIENAVKYTPNDGRIEVKTEEIENKVVFTVNDTGPGIPKSDRDHLFEKFYRGQAQQGPTKGTGLGLFLVKYFIELHGGEVFLESELGKGTRVGFTLPLQA